MIKENITAKQQKEIEDIFKKEEQKHAIENIFNSIYNCNYCPIRKSCDFVENEIGYTICKTLNINDDLKIDF